MNLINTHERLKYT